MFPRPCSLAPRRPVVGTLQRGLEAAAGASRDGGPSLRSSLMLFFPCCCGTSITFSVWPPPPSAVPVLCRVVSSLPRPLGFFGRVRALLPAGTGSSWAGGAEARAGPPTGQCGARPAVGRLGGLHRCWWGRMSWMKAEMPAWEVGCLGPAGVGGGLCGTVTSQPCPLPSGGLAGQRSRASLGCWTWAPPRAGWGSGYQGCCGGEPCPGPREPPAVRCSQGVAQPDPGQALWVMQLLTSVLSSTALLGKGV